MGADVREAGPADAPRIAELLGQLGYPASHEEVARRLQYWAATPNSCILLADESGLVVGCLSVHAVPYLERTGCWARIESLVVDTTVRGRGVGRALVAAAESMASGWGCLDIEVTSSRTRADAHCFYARLGYTDVCDRSGRFIKPLGRT